MKILDLGFGRTAEVIKLGACICASDVRSKSEDISDGIFWNLKHDVVVCVLREFTSSLFLLIPLHPIPAC